MLQVIGAGISAIGQIAAGQAAKEASDLNAFQIETDKELNKVQALQRSRSRREEYIMARSANIAAFSAAGRDIASDRSVEAFLKRQQEIVADDTSRIDQQVQFENVKAGMAASAERRRGRNALSAAMFSAVGTVSEGIYRQKTVGT
jgi:hypothetical protein